MAENRPILVGLDLSNDYTQLCCFGSKGEPYSVSLGSDPQKYRIPTVLCAEDGASEWSFGEEAVRDAVRSNRILIGDIVKKAETNDITTVFGISYTADVLLGRFFRRIFTALRTKVDYVEISGIVVTVRSKTNELDSVILSALEPLGIRPDKVKVISHLESFMYYVVSQNGDIWINDVGLFDFEKNGMVYYRLSFGRKQSPLTIVADKTVLDDTITYDMLGVQSPERLTYAFENIISLAINKQVVSALYFTGAGFESNWADDVLKKLCTNRRVFRGQNLFVKGAGYASKLFFVGGLEDYVLVGDSVLRSSISMRLYADGRYKEIPMALIGEPYGEVNKELEVILDGTNELDFIVHNVLKKDFLCAIMTLDGMVIRKDRTNKVNIQIRFLDRETCIITVHDVGFGDIHSTNYRIWEQILKV